MAFYPTAASYITHLEFSRLGIENDPQRFQDRDDTAISRINSLDQKIDISSHISQSCRQPPFHNSTRPAVHPRSKSSFGTTQSSPSSHALSSFAPYQCLGGDIPNREPILGIYIFGGYPSITAYLSPVSQADHAALEIKLRKAKQTNVHNNNDNDVETALPKTWFDSNTDILLFMGTVDNHKRVTWKPFLLRIDNDERKGIRNVAIGWNVFSSSEFLAISRTRDSVRDVARAICDGFPGLKRLLIIPSRLPEKGALLLNTRWPTDEESRRVEEFKWEFVKQGLGGLVQVVKLEAEAEVRTDAVTEAFSTHRRSDPW